MSFRAIRRVSVVLLVSLVLAAPVDAQESGDEVERCVGWAIPGAVLGLAAGFGIVASGYALAGEPIGDSAGDVALILAGESLGMTFGPVASCAVFADEPYTIPAASFAIGGGLIGGTVVGVPLMLVMVSRDGLLVPGSEAGDAAFFGDVLLFTGAVVAGIGLGGWLGLLVEDSLRGDRGVSLSLTATDGGGKVGLTVRF